MYEYRKSINLCLDLRTYFEYPDLPTLQRIGVVTSIRFDGTKQMIIRGGIGDEGLHDNLARKTGPASSKIIQLPDEMRTKKGSVTGWYDPKVSTEEALGLGLVVGQLDRSGFNDRSTMDYR